MTTEEADLCHAELAIRKRKSRVALIVIAAICCGTVAFAQPAETAAADPAPAAQLKPTTTERHPESTASKKAAPADNANKDTKADTKPSTKTASRGNSSSESEQSIVALINDEPITGYEIQQRSMMLSGGGMQQKAQENFKAILKDPRTTERLKAILAETIKANEGKSKEQIIAIFEQRKKAFGMELQKQAVERARASIAPGMKKAALEELIDEKLKLQEAKRQNVNVGDDEIDRVMNSIAERNKLTKEQFLTQLGGGVDAMKNRIRSTLSWTEVVRKRFGAQIAIATRDIDKLVASSSTTAQDDVELQVQRIRIAMPAKLEQSVIAQHMQEAEKMRSKFTNCKSMSAIANGVPGAKFEELGKRRPSTLQEPTRTLLLNAKDGEMLPPSMGEGGVELWAVCGREVVKGEETKRTQAEGELKQKEFEILAKRYLKDLRQDAHIEYR